MAQRELPVVEVRWHDATSTSGWGELNRHLADSDEGCLAIRTVGMLVHRSKRRVCVALSQDQNGKIDDMLAIPAGWVESVRPLGRRAR